MSGYYELESRAKCFSRYAHGFLTSRECMDIPLQNSNEVIQLSVSLRCNYKLFLSAVASVYQVQSTYRPVFYVDAAKLSVYAQGFCLDIFIRYLHKE